MKIKHFAGYGSVNAKKISTVKLTTNIYRVVIEVTGNHEWGLYRGNIYDVYSWLMKRLCKNCKSYTDVVHVDVIKDCIFDGLEYRTEKCTYIIQYKAEQ